jgi:Protein of unknown function (DUF1778)
LNVYKQERRMPRAIFEDNSRLALRVRADDKATLMRAAAIAHTDMTDFVLRHALDAARKVIEQAERVSLSERNSPKPDEGRSQGPIDKTPRPCPST